MHKKSSQCSPPTPRPCSPLLQILLNTKIKLLKYLQQQQPIYAQLGRTCSILLYFVKKGIYGQLLDQAERALLVDCVTIVKMLVVAAEVGKFGVRFGAAASLVARYEKYIKSTLQLNQHQLHNLTQSHQQTPQNYKSTSNPPQISLQDLTFLTNPPAIITNFFLQTSPNLPISHPHCLGCAQVFRTDVPIRHFNPGVGVVGLGVGKIMEGVFLGRVINSVGNWGWAGVVFVGVESRDGGMYPVGIQCRSQQQAQKYLAQISSVLSSIHPRINYKIDLIPILPPVHPPTPPSTPTSFCFKILLSPSKPNIIHYIEYSVKGYQSSYEVYRMGTEASQDWGKDRVKNLGIGVDVELEGVGVGTKFYEVLHRRFREEWRREGNSHQGVCCWRAGDFKFQEKSQNGEQQENISTVTKKYESQKSVSLSMSTHPQNIYSHQDTPKLPYHNASLLTLKTKKDNRYIETFTKILQNQKLKIELSKPYQNTFKNISRSIWLISHQIKSKELQGELILSQDKELLPKDVITVIPVHRNLQIDRSKLSEYNQQVFSNKFKLRYSWGYRTETAVVLDKNKKEKTILYMIFQDYSEAIYAYLIFEELNLRPYFVRQLISLMKNKNKPNASI